jgi:hypothetical protein
MGLPFLAKKKLIMDSELIRIIEDYGCYATNDLETIEALGRYCSDNNIAYRVNESNGRYVIMTEYVNVICLNETKRTARVFNGMEIIGKIDKKRFQSEHTTFTIIEYIYPSYGDSMRRILIERYGRKYKYDKPFYWIFQDKQFYVRYFANH